MTPKECRLCTDRYCLELPGVTGRSEYHGTTIIPRRTTIDTCPEKPDQELQLWDMVERDIDALVDLEHGDGLTDVEAGMSGYFLGSR